MLGEGAIAFFVTLDACARIICDVLKTLAVVTVPSPSSRQLETSLMPDCSIRHYRMKKETKTAGNTGAIRRIAIDMRDLETTAQFYIEPLGLKDVGARSTLRPRTDII
jgi:hypothetical protein